MLKSKHTKIVATVGPASEAKDTLREMILAGMNVVRLNFSHGEHEWHGMMINRVRELSEELGVPIAILADIQGPRIRTRVAEAFRVTAGTAVLAADPSEEGKLPVTGKPIFFFDQPGIIVDVEVDHLVLIEDGTIQFRVVKKEGNVIELEAINDGEVKNRKGINLPDSPIKLPVITEKDRRDLQFIMGQDVDYVGLSFVGSAEDVRFARELMTEYSGLEKDLLPRIIVKIERKEAIKNLDEIIAETDAVMVARGDLGIELPETRITIYQKEIIAKSLSLVRPVIVATQMMKSMAENPRPTRAEVSDVTNAVCDHADAVMLSEESAMGKYPVETIRTMAEIIRHTEGSPFDDVYQAIGMNLRNEYAVMVRSVYELARSYDARTILLLSESGFTARLMSHFRPDSDLYVATNNRRAWYRTALMWGVEAHLFEDRNGLDGIMDELVAKLRNEDKLRKGDRAVLCLGRHRKSDQLQLIGVKEIE